jgi:hypothetical protein
MSKFLPSLKSPVARLAILVLAILVLGSIAAAVTRSQGLWEPMASRAPAPTVAEAGIASHGPAHDLLPSGGLGAAWSKTNPVGLGDLQGQTFLQTPQQYGINTIGTSKKNQSYDIRSGFVVPKADVGPWMRSSIEPDTMWKGIDVGMHPA